MGKVFLEYIYIYYALKILSAMPNNIRQRNLYIKSKITTSLIKLVSNEKDNLAFYLRAFAYLGARALVRSLDNFTSWNTTYGRFFLSLIFAHLRIIQPVKSLPSSTHCLLFSIVYDANCCP